MATNAPSTEQIDRHNWNCPECGKTPVRKSAKGPFPMFCSDECKTRCERRKLADGRVIIDLAKAWRICRNNKGDAALGAACLSEMSTILDHMNERDRKLGRTTARLLGYVSRIIGGGQYNHDYRTMTHGRRDERAAPETTVPEIVEGLRSIQERFGDQLSNLEANALGFAIEKYA